MGLFQDWLVVSKRLDPGSSTLARDDTVYSLMGLFRAGWLFLKDWITALWPGGRFFQRRLMIASENFVLKRAVLSRALKPVLTERNFSVPERKPL
ncbi:MAG: hypothetical protein BWX75_00272 [Candidatus Cloacimonetes bacterium ADurb.Bin088]|nr:MAG: hypothetical protein BWX75_00272 [Candidatus Cloacimonetes bacterium ADurb.Bin088]